MKLDLGFLRDFGVDVNLGIEYTGGQDRYVSALRRFYISFDSNIEKIREYLDKKDTENYTILVHALKSNSRMVGAIKLSEKFEALEKAGREGALDVMEADTEKALSDYEAFITLIKPIGEAEIEKPADELTAGEAREVLAKLLAALDDFDDELSMELAKKLAGYPFRLGPKEKLKEATDYIGRFLYDEAAGIIKEIEDTIS